MEKLMQIHRLLLGSRRLAWVMIGMALVVLAGAVLLTTLKVRQQIREQIVGRDGEVLYAVALLQYQEEATLGSPPADAASQLSVLLKTSQLKGVMGARLFDHAGGFVQSFPPEVQDGLLEPSDLAALRARKPVCRFQAAASLAALFVPDPAKEPSLQNTIPVLEVSVPLHAAREGPVEGMAQFLIEGQSIAAEFARLDRSLVAQALWIFAVGGSLLALAMSLAFRRLRHAYRLVGQRTNDLVRANQELALAAKTSALGAVTAHLLHGLKNPLAGLQTFVRAQESGSAGVEPSDWQEAVASTRKMQAMIQEVVSLLHEEETSLHYEISLRELGEAVASRVMPRLREKQVEFRMQLTSGATLPNRVANLLALVLANLLQNAAEAAPVGSTVSLCGLSRENQLVFEVSDQGPGFPGSITPFAPCRSEKIGGSGIGLALCKQLANHLGAELELSSNTPKGCRFSLRLAASLCNPELQAEAQPLPAAR